MATTEAHITATSLCGCPITGKTVFHRDECEHTVANTPGWRPEGDRPLRLEILDELLRALLDVAAHSGVVSTPLQVHHIPREIFDTLPGEERAIGDRADGEDFWSKTHPMHFWNGEVGASINLVFFTDEPPASSTVDEDVWVVMGGTTLYSSKPTREEAEQVIASDRDLIEKFGPARVEHRVAQLRRDV